MNYTYEDVWHILPGDAWTHRVVSQDRSDAGRIIFDFVDQTVRVRQADSVRSLVKSFYISDVIPIMGVTRYITLSMADVEHSVQHPFASTTEISLAIAPKPHCNTVSRLWLCSDTGLTTLIPTTQEVL